MWMNTDDDITWKQTYFNINFPDKPTSLQEIAIKDILSMKYLHKYIFQKDCLMAVH